MSWQDLVGWSRDLFSLGLVRALIVVVAGWFVGKLAARTLSRIIERRTHHPQPPIVYRLVHYGVVVVTLIVALEELGFDAGVLLGAAGILTIAIGFASQTSASNLISGLFLITERPFVIGDVIKVGTTIGTTHSIGLMSVTLRTFDNLYVRVPNELLIKSEITNFSRFPLRRFDLDLRVRLDEDIARVETLLRELVHEHPLILEEPSETFLFLAYSPSSYDFRFSVWARQEDFLTVRNELPRLVKITFDAHGIEIPMPRQTIEYASATSGTASRHLPAPPPGAALAPAPPPLEPSSPASDTGKDAGFEPPAPSSSTR